MILSELSIPEVEFIPNNKVIPFKNAINVYRLDVAARQFGEKQKVEDFDWIKTSQSTWITKDHFACMQDCRRIYEQSYSKWFLCHF